MRRVDQGEAGRPEVHSGLFTGDESRHRACGSPAADEGGCTGIVAMGFATCDGVSRIGQTHDRVPSSALGLSGVTRTLEIREDPATGTRVIGDLRACPDRFDAWLSSRGIARISNLRAPRTGVSGDCAFAFADATECQLLEIAFLQQRYPSAVAPGSGDASRVLPLAGGALDAVEQLTQAAKLPAGTFVVHRPIRDAAAAVSNRFISPRLRRLEQVAWGAERQKRAQRLLGEREGRRPFFPFASRGITTPFMFRVLRSHPLGYDLTYEFDDRGNISVVSFGWRTVFAEISELGQPHETMGILWATANFPPTSPFLPFFIGLPEVPASYGPGDGNRTSVFETLFRSAIRSPEAVDRIQVFWEQYEFQVFADLKRLRADIGAARATSEPGRAEKLLFTFCKEKCDESVELAESMVAELGDGFDAA